MSRGRQDGAAVTHVRLPPVAAGQRIGLFGGSFNPPHEAHLLVAEIALKRLGLDAVWWMVTPGNPLKSRVALPPLEARMADAQLFARDRRIVVTGFERELRSTSTEATVAFLTQRHADVHFVWVMGADCLAEFHRWRRWRRIFLRVPVAVVDRPGYRFKGLAAPAARAFGRSRVNERLAGGLAERPAPAWTFLTGRLSPQSSTRLRALAARGVQ